MKLLDIEQLTSSKYLNMYKLKLINRVGNRKDYYVASRRTKENLTCVTKDHNRCDGVMIIPFTENDEIVMIRQYRPAIGDYLYELPAGIVDPGETIEEAARRGLPNLKSFVEAIPALTSEQSVELFEKFHVFTRTELESRAEIKYENYAKIINIEAKTMIDMASKQFIPAVMKYTKELADTINAVRAAGADVSVQMEILGAVTALLIETRNALRALGEVSEEARTIEGAKERAEYYYAKVCPAMEALRAPVDELEMIVDKEDWTMYSYGDLIFEV